MTLVRVKHCCCGCTLDIGARIIIWTDLISTIMVGLSVIANFGHDSVAVFSAIIIPIKFVILIGAVMGVNKKKASYVHPYVIYNVLAVITMGILIVVATVKFNDIVDSDLMKNLTGDWENVKKQVKGIRVEHDSELDDVFGRPTQGVGILERSETEHAIRVFFLIFAIIGGIVNFFAWTYFNIILYSYYKTLLEGGNFTNEDGVEYFAPTEQTGGKNVSQGATSQYNIPPSYFAAAPYPTQPVIPYSEAPPSYDGVVGPNAYSNPSFPPTKQ